MENGHAAFSPAGPASALVLDLIVPALPPRIDGIGDYTARLAAELAASGLAKVRILTGEQSPAPIAGVDIETVFDPMAPASTKRITAAVAARRPDWVVLQYNPFGYGKRGLNLRLPREMRRIGAMAPTTRLAVMFHETYMMPVSSLKTLLMNTYQRYQFARIGKAAKVLFFSIEPWADEHRPRFAPRPVRHLPVGANITRVEIDRAEARGRIGIADDEIVLGVFGTAHVSRMFGHVRAAAETLLAAGRSVRVLYIGSDGAAVRTAMGGHIPVISDGPHPANEVSRRLAAVDIFLATYSDGVSTRRGAMMAAMQHALPVVGTIGHNTDGELKAANEQSFFLVPANDLTAYTGAVSSLAADSARRQKFASAAQDMYERRYSWRAIADSMLTALRSATSSTAPV